MLDGHITKPIVMRRLIQEQLEQFEAQCLLIMIAQGNALKRTRNKPMGNYDKEFGGQAIVISVN